MRASDAGDRALIAQEGVELSSLALEDLGERVGIQIERIRSRCARSLSS